MIEQTKFTEEINNRRGRKRRKKHGGNAREVKKISDGNYRKDRDYQEDKNYREDGCDRAERTDKEYINYR